MPMRVEVRCGSCGPAPPLAEMVEFIDEAHPRRWHITAVYRGWSQPVDPFSVEPVGDKERTITRAADVRRRGKAVLLPPCRNCKAKPTPRMAKLKVAAEAAAAPAQASGQRLATIYV